MRIRKLIPKERSSSHSSPSFEDYNLAVLEIMDRDKDIRFFSDLQAHIDYPVKIQHNNSNNTPLDHTLLVPSIDSTIIITHQHKKSHHL